MEITTKSPQKLYNGSFFGSFFTQKSFFSPLKSFWPQVLKTRFHFRKHCFLHEYKIQFRNCGQNHKIRFSSPQRCHLPLPSRPWPPSLCCSVWIHIIMWCSVVLRVLLAMEEKKLSGSSYGKSENVQNQYAKGKGEIWWPNKFMWCSDQLFCEMKATANWQSASKQ